MNIRCFILLVVLLFSLPLVSRGQVLSADSSSVCAEGVGEYAFEWRKTILPTSLIAVGAVGLAPGVTGNASRSITHGVIDLRGNHSRLVFDDYVQYLPVASALLMGSAGVEARHAIGERALIVATSYAALAVLTNIPKRCVNEQRPEFAGHNSFPSGHTATAFMGAELVRIEYGGWYGVGAYAAATGVGFMRMYNGRHWFHDVVAGAGVGILSARLGQWSCGLWRSLLGKKRKKNADIVFAPVVAPIGGGYYGFSMGCAL